MHTPSQGSSITLHAGCKINLYLEITGLRKDGYHELDTLFYPVPEPFDTLDITGRTEGGFTFSCNRKDLETDTNIVVQAFQTFAQQTGYQPHCHVHLEKSIPDGAGLGGGSSDAAALLRWLNASAGEKALSHDALVSLAAGIGADVPFFLYNTPCRATGIGERLLPVSTDLTGFTLLLVCPAASVPTGWAYRQWDTTWISGKNKKSSVSSLTSNRPAVKKCASRALWLFNSFEAVVFPAFPELRAYKELLIAHGAAAALMSGSGASLFALYREMEMACSVKKVLDTFGAATYIHRL